MNITIILYNYSNKYYSFWLGVEPVHVIVHAQVDHWRQLAVAGANYLEVVLDSVRSL